MSHFIVLAHFKGAASDQWVELAEFPDIWSLLGCFQDYHPSWTYSERSGLQAHGTDEQWPKHLDELIVYKSDLPKPNSEAVLNKISLYLPGVDSQ